MKRKKSPSQPVSHFLLRLFISIFVGVLVSATAWFVFPAPHKSVICANSISCTKELSGHIENNASGVFDKQKVLPPPIILSLDNKDKAVLGASVAPGKKHVYVDLTTQTLYAYQGETLVMKTLVSTGKWHPTPTGDFTVWIKIRATRMTGGTGDDYYDLPDVPYVMYFFNADVPKSAGFSLHGAYWHNNFGHPMSHGCVNMRIVDAEKLYNWIDPPTDGLTTYATEDNPGTTITITGTAPGE
ncbi:MAG TPA: L,D-transpeptidase [Patescibacteria group bacterium]|nr:L,D-transpeptidase [Patescibacteria group bacterium]